MPRVLFTVLLTMLLGGCGPAEQPATPDDESGAAVTPATLVLRGGRLATLDPATKEATALAITGHEITAVGSDEFIAGFIGTDTQVVDLDGRLAVPGFIEGHGHYLSLGRARQILDLNDAESYDDIVTLVAAAVDGAEPGDWILGRGWHQEKWSTVPADAVDGVPQNDSLSAISPDNPVLLGHASGHAVFVNDAALAAAGIDGDTPDPSGGTIVRNAGGEATGLLRENAEDLVQAAYDAFEATLDPAQREATLREQVALAGQEALAHGVTSFHDAGSSFAEIDFFRALEAEGALPVRLYVMVRRESNDAMDARLPDYYMPLEGNDFLTVRSIKRQLDGALGAHGAWLLAPYSDMPESTGLVLEPVEEIEGTAAVALKHGFQLNVHAIGDRANREVLDLYERAWEAAEVDGSRLRWRIEHAQHIDPADLPRFGALGVVAAVQGVHCTSDGPWIPQRLGEARTASTSYRWRDLIDTGALVGNGTDVPVEPIDPIASFTASVTRVMNNGEAFHPDQAMTRREALASYTLNNAVAAFEEQAKGSLTPGKLADVAVLSQDLLTVPEAELGATLVDMTILGGEVVYVR